MTEETQVSRGLAEEKRPKLRVSAVTISPTVVAKSKLPPHLQRRFEESSISRNNSPAAIRNVTDSAISISPMQAKSGDAQDDYLEGAVQATMKDLEPSASAYGDYLDEDEDDEEDVSVVDDCPSPSEKARIKLVQLKKKTCAPPPSAQSAKSNLPPRMQRRFEETSISRNNSPAGRPVSISPTAVTKSKLPPHLQRRFEESSISRNSSPNAPIFSPQHKALGKVEVEDDYLEGAVQATMKDLEPSASAYGDYLDEDEEEQLVVDECPSPSERARIKLVQLKKKASAPSPVVSVFSTAFPFDEDEDKGKGKDNTDSYEGSYSETDAMVSDFRKIRQQLDQKKKAREDLITFAAAMMEEDLDF